MISTASNASWTARCEKLKKQFSIVSEQLTPSPQPSQLPPSESLTIHAMIDAMNACVLVLSSDGIIEYVNFDAARMLASSKVQLQGRNILEFLGEDSRDEYESLFASCAAFPNDKIKHGAKEVRVMCEDNQEVAADLSIASLHTSHNSVRLIAILHDLTIHKVKQAKLHRQALTDCLTGLANRRSLKDALLQSWQYCQDSQETLSLLMIDVDYFKQFNDKFGHLNGDKCLVKLAQAIQSCMPTQDAVAARYGGEEFVVLLPQNALSLAHIVAVRIKRKIEQLTFEELGLSFDAQVTVSIGIAHTVPSNDLSMVDLLASADRALLEAKSQGRNCIVSA